MSTKWRLLKKIAHGGTVPRCWRMAWYEPKRRIGVYSPVPLHLALRLIRETIHRVRMATNAPPIERAEVLEMHRMHRERQLAAREYSRGFLAGWRDCFQACLAAVEEETEHGAVWDMGDLLAQSHLNEPQN